MNRAQYDTLALVLFVLNAAFAIGAFASGNISRVDVLSAAVAGLLLGQGFKR